MSQIARNQQVHDLIAAGKPAQALALARRLAQSGGRAGAPALDAMRAALIASGQTLQALHFAQQAVKADPGSVAMLLELARVHSLLGQFEDEARVLREALPRDPSNPALPGFLASALERLHLFDDAERVARAGLQRFPREPALQQRLASIVATLGRPAEAAAIYEDALRDRPDDRELSVSYPAVLQYQSPGDPARLLGAHRHFGRLLEAAGAVPPEARRARAASHAPLNDPSRPPRPLRLGFLSSDLKQHSVASFVRPLLEHLDPALATPLLYMAGWVTDQVTEALRGAAERAGGSYRHVCALSDADLARTIKGDRVDVLVELNGLTRDNRLGALRFAPAPVVVHWCGYPSTCGTNLLDYRVVDSITDPPGSAEGWLVEAPLRLDPCFTCYAPPDDAPDVAPPPRAERGHVTFGSFNMIQKVNDDVLACWARVLRAVPGSRLMLKAMMLTHASVREALLARARAAGIDPERLTILPPTRGVREHLETYAQVDIALDTFPYAGTTTTCEALWMGVPVVTLAPPDALHAQRVGASLLSAVGRTDLVARDVDDYVDRVRALAMAPATLDTRRDLRHRLLTGALGDGRAFAQRMMLALRGVFEHARAIARGEAPQG